VRAGALKGARDRYDKLRDSLRLDSVSDKNLAADIAALDGRLWKDLAKRSGPSEALRCELLSAKGIRFGL